MLEYRETMKRKVPMEKQSRTLFDSDQAFSCSLDALDALQELERRRLMVEEGSSRLLDGTKHLEAVIEDRRRARYV